jgi:hypothetical protein
MISDSADEWEDEILPALRSDLAKFMGGAGNDSVQDSIIVASLRSITGKDSQCVKDLLKSSAVFGEDQRVPTRKVFGILNAASATLLPSDAEAQHPTEGRVKRWVSILIKRSLYLVPVKGSVQLHDIGTCALLFDTWLTCVLC